MSSRSPSLPYPYGATGDFDESIMEHHTYTGFQNDHPQPPGFSSSYASQYNYVPLAPGTVEDSSSGTPYSPGLYQNRHRPDQELQQSAAVGTEPFQSLLAPFSNTTTSNSFRTQPYSDSTAYHQGLGVGENSQAFSTSENPYSPLLGNFSQICPVPEGSLSNSQFNVGAAEPAISSRMSSAPTSVVVPAHTSPIGFGSACPSKKATQGKTRRSRNPPKQLNSSPVTPSDAEHRNGNVDGKASGSSSCRVSKRARLDTDRFPASAVKLFELNKAWIRDQNAGSFPDEDQLIGLHLISKVPCQIIKEWFEDHWSPTEAKNDSGYLTMGETISPDLIEAALLKVLETWKGCSPGDNQGRGEGPYECTLLCGRLFKTRSVWDRHEKLTDPQEVWVCSICYYRKDPPQVEIFHLKQQLVKHFKRHKDDQVPDAESCRVRITPEARFPCRICPEDFKEWRDRTCHVVKHFKRGGRRRDDERDHTSDDADSDDDSPDGSSSGDMDMGDPNDDHHEGQDGSNDSGRVFGRPQGRDSGYNQQTNQQQGNQLALTLRTRPQDPEQLLEQDGEGNLISLPGMEPKCPPTAMCESNCQVSDLPVGGHLGKSNLYQSLEVGPDDSDRGWHQNFGPADLLPFVSMKRVGYTSSACVDIVYWKDADHVVARKAFRSFPRPMISQFMNEVQILKGLRHAHIVNFVGTYSQGKEVAIIMSPAADCDLGSYMEYFTFGHLAAKSELLRQWFSCLAEAVKYMHKERVRHMDIKPSNILVYQRNILLCDFGLSERFTNDESTTSGGGPVTIMYAAPEAVSGQRQGRASDIFSLGCVFLEMATVLAYRSRDEFLNYRSAACTNESTDATYYRNLPAVMKWIAMLRQTKLAPPTPQALDACKVMLSLNHRDRPDAVQLSKIFSPGPCCMGEMRRSALENWHWGQFHSNLRHDRKGGAPPSEVVTSEARSLPAMRHVSEPPEIQSLYRGIPLPPPVFESSGSLDCEEGLRFGPGAMSPSSREIKSPLAETNPSPSRKALKSPLTGTNRVSYGVVAWLEEDTERAPWSELNATIPLSSRKRGKLTRHIELKFNGVRQLKCWGEVDQMCDRADVDVETVLKTYYELDGDYELIHGVTIVATN